MITVANSGFACSRQSCHGAESCIRAKPWRRAMIGGRWSGRDTRRYTSSSGPGPNSHRHARWLYAAYGFIFAATPTRLTVTNWDVTRRPRDGHVLRPSPRWFGDSFAANSLRRWPESLESAALRSHLSATCAWCELAGDDDSLPRRSRETAASVSPDDSAPSSIRGLEIERFEEDPRCRYPTALPLANTVADVVDRI